MKKRGIWTAIILWGMVLCGCGTSSESEVTVSVEQEVQEEKDFRKPESETTEIETQKQEEFLSEVSLWGQDMYASTILEDEEALYFVGNDHIRKIEKESGTEQFIWEGSEGRTEDAKMVYNSARGILILDRIYFMESWDSEDEAGVIKKYALSVVSTDGKGYERLQEITVGLDGGLVLIDGILYYEGSHNSLSLNGFAVDQNGNVRTDKEVVMQASDIPDGYTLPYYYQNGYRTMTVAESKSRYGFYLLRDNDYHLCKFDPKTGKVEKLPDYLDAFSLHAVNETFLLFVSYMEEKMYLYEYKTGALRSLGDFDSHCAVIAMDEEYLYLQRTVNGDDFTQYHYEQISLKKGEVNELFVVDEITGISVEKPQTIMETAVLDGYIYYPGAKNYKLYVMRRDLEMPNAEEVLGSEFYDSKIGEIGSVKTYKEKIYSRHKPDWVTASADLEWLVVDQSFPGAANINRILEETQQQNIAYEQENARLQDEWYLESQDDYPTIAFSMESNISPIYYWDGKYLSFVQQNYDYSGGAHGMPYWNGYVFNVHTGQQLGLADIVADDEIQIKGLVTQYFTDMYNESPDMYWEGAVDTVFEYTTLDSQFYLNEEGIVFYFGPYDLAPYAAGFQEIVVPYSAWDLKIDLE